MNALEKLSGRSSKLSDIELRKEEFVEYEKMRHTKASENRRKIITSKVIKSFGQWVVTTYGIECCKGRAYAIEKERLDEDWLAHMTEKWWVEPDEFFEALNYARKYYKIKQTEFYK